MVLLSGCVSFDIKDLDETKVIYGIYNGYKKDVVVNYRRLYEVQIGTSKVKVNHYSINILHNYAGQNIRIVLHKWSTNDVEYYEIDEIKVGDWRDSMGC